MGTFYLRQGAWCTCERSCNTAEATLEVGVSVFELAPAVGARWLGAGAAFAKRRRALGGQVHLLAAGGPLYLVSGDAVGRTGADGEPLIRSVEVHGELAWDGDAFVQVSACAEKPVKTHPGYPECRCYGVDDLNEPGEGDDGQPAGDDAGDGELEDIEF